MHTTLSTQRARASIRRCLTAALCIGVWLASASSTLALTVGISPDDSNPPEKTQMINTLTSLGHTVVQTTNFTSVDVFVNVSGAASVGPTAAQVTAGAKYVQIGDWGSGVIGNTWVGIAEGANVSLTLGGTPHPILTGLPASWTSKGFHRYGYLFSDYIGGGTLGSDPALITATQGSNSFPRALTARTIGAGRAVYLGWGPYGNSAAPQDLLVLKNAIEWAATGTVVQKVLVCAPLSFSTDVVTKLQATGLYTAVDFFNVNTGTPTLAQLQAYNAVLVYSDSSFANATLLGNNLADYVDSGGGLAMATFAFHTPGLGLTIAGRIVSGGYLPYTLSNQTGGNGLTLVPDVPGHLLLAGVASFNGGTASYQNDCALAPGATLVAHWSNGKPLIAYKQVGPRPVVGLNFFPPSSTIRSDFWVASTDGVRMMTNALSYVAGVAAPPALPPTVTTDAASPVGTTTASLIGTVNPNGSATNAFFQYGTSPTLAGATSTGAASVGSGTSGVGFSIPISGLTPHTTYYFRAVGTNSAGTTNGNILSFVTGNTNPTAPAATIVATTADTQTYTLPYPLTDADGDAVTLDTVSAGVGLSLNGTSGNTVTFTAASSFVGATSLNYTVRDNFTGSASGTITVNVTDNDAPVVTPPANIVAEATGPGGATVNYSAAMVTDNIGIASVNYSQASGTPFPLGMTTVNITAQDAAGNTGTGSFTVTVVDTTGPIVMVPPNITAEATGPGGAVVTFTTSAIDTVSGPRPTNAVPPSGSLFALGTTTVNVSAMDAAGNPGSASFTVTVVDTTAPSITVPANITAEATGPGGATVNFAVSANDSVNGVVAANAVPPSGSLFPLGTTTVNVSAQDTAGNPASASFTVTVEDTTGPVLNLPGTITVTSNSASGKIVNFTVSATDTVEGILPATATPPSGSLFPLGTTTVTVTAEDSEGNETTGTFDVVVNPVGKIIAGHSGGQVPNGGSWTFRGTAGGETTEPTGYVQNIGVGTLHVSSVSIEGPDAAHFTQVAVPTPLLTGRSFGLYVAFAPQSLGPKTATLKIVSDDPDDSPYFITLLGVGGELTPGNFAGFLRDNDDAVQGAVNITYGTTGALTGTVLYAGRRYSFRAAAGAGEVWTAQARGSGATLNVLVNELNGSLEVTITAGAVTLTSETEKSPYDRTHPAPQAGRYNVALPAPVGVPVGHGFGVFRVNRTGTIRATGAMGDGTRFSTASTVLSGARAPIFLLLPAVQKCRGTFVFAPAQTSDVAGDLDWHTATFETTIAASGATVGSLPSGPVTLTVGAPMTFTGATTLVGGSATFGTGPFGPIQVSVAPSGSTVVRLPTATLPRGFRAKALVHPKLNAAYGHEGRCTQ